MVTEKLNKGEITELKIKELKVIAKALKIDKYYQMNKRDLISAIEVVRSGDTSLQKKPKRDKKMCEHGRVKYFCKECGGKGICEHGKNKSYCKECGGSQVCKHGKSKYFCKECSGKGICEHGNNKFICKECSK